jgi:predicted enzyme related to lactoylglutathione lyase
MGLERAAEEFRQRGGSIIEGPFEVMIGRAAVVEDPWGNRVVLIDSSKGPITSIRPSRQRP